MDKKLPNVYANNVDKVFDNVQNVFYSSKESNQDRNLLEEDNSSIELKINKIFNSSDFVYKSDVEIETDNGLIRKTIVGKTSDSLLTLDNESISFREIKNIRKV